MTIVPESAISAMDARELTDRIKVGVEAVWDLIKQAYMGRAWAVLGYSSWDDYCTREFGSSRLRLPREERREVVASLREIGMSTRAIAAATGNSTRTITGDLREVSQSTTPELVTGTDGKTYVPKPVTDMITQEELDELNTMIGQRVDPMPESKDSHKSEETSAKRGRKPLPDLFWQAALDVRKGVERLDRLVADDRFERNREKVAERNLGDLSRVEEILKNILNRLTTGV